MRETWVRSLGWEDPLEKEMATHSSILDWRIPWMEEPSGLQSTGSQQRVRHDWSTSLSTRIVYFSLQATSVSVWLKLVHLIPRWFTQTGSVCQLGVIMTQSSSMGVPQFGYLGFLRAWWLIPPHTMPLLLCSLAQSSHGPCLPGQGGEEGVDKKYYYLLMEEVLKICSHFYWTPNVHWRRSTQKIWYYSWMFITFLPYRKVSVS